MSLTPLEPEYEGGVPVFKPTYEDFKDFSSFVNRIEPIGMQSGIVKIIPPREWLAKLPKLTTDEIEQIEIRSPIIQNLIMAGGKGVYEVENVEKKKKFSIKQWIKQCNQLANQPPARRGEKQRVLGEFIAPPGESISYDDSDFSGEMLEHLESRFWKGLSFGGAPMYGADLPGSLFTHEVKEWNVAHLDSLLSALPYHVPGVTDAYLYCGMWKAIFAWHLEDMDLPSINYIHFGAPKQWYSIPQSHHQQFYQLMSAIWPDEQRKCSEFLRHKTFLADPEFIRKQGIPVNQIVHKQQEFMITFPYGYHSGFNYGFNIAESVNFAHDSWLSIGLNARKCQCVSHSVGIDTQQLVEIVKSQQRQDKMGGHKYKFKESVVRESNGTQPKRHGKCVLCPHVYTGRYISNSRRTALAHIQCANLTPETYIVGNTVYGLEDIPRDRFSLRCGFCKTRSGSCFQCSKLECTRAYHGSCAAAAGVDYRDPHYPLCKHHRSPPTQAADTAMSIHGDVVQYLKHQNYGAGIVTVNNRNTQQIEVSILPDQTTQETVSYSDIVAELPEIPRGPFVEQLIPFAKVDKTKKRLVSIKRGSKEPSGHTDEIKIEPVRPVHKDLAL